MGKVCLYLFPRTMIKRPNGPWLDQLVIVLEFDNDLDLNLERQTLK